MTETSRIQLSRSKYIEESRAIAVLRLNEYDFYPGEIVMMSYYKNPDFRNDIGVLVAIGVKKGIGERSLSYTFSYNCKSFSLIYNNCIRK